MRIAMVASLLGVEATGQSIAVAVTAGNLAAAGATVTVLGTDGGYRGRPVSRLVAMPPQVTSHIFPSTGALNRRVYRSTALLAWLEEHIDDFDILDVQGIWSWSGMAAARLFRRHGKPYILTPHGAMTRYDWRKSPWQRRLFWLRFGAVWREADAVRFLSAGEESMSFHPPKGRAVVIPNGIDLQEAPTNERRSQARSRLGISDEAAVLLFVGRITHQKGVKEIVAAFEVAAFEVAARALPHLRLYLVGPAEGEYGAAVSAMVAQSPVRDRITLTGAIFTDAKSDFYRAADAFITLSHNEGMSFAQLEALSHGLPLILTKSSNLDSLEAFGAGILTHHDAVTSAQAIVKLMQDAEARQFAGLQARRLVEEKFSWQHVAPQLVALYDELIAQSQTGGDV